MTAPTYTQQQTPHLFGQTPGYDPFSPFGTNFQGGLGQQFNQQWGQQPFGQQQWGQQPFGQQQWGQPFGQQQWGQQQGTDLYTLAWQLLGYAQQSIQLAQQIVTHSLQQQSPYQMMGQRGFQRQPMAW